MRARSFVRVGVDLPSLGFVMLGGGAFPLGAFSLFFGRKALPLGASGLFVCRQLRLFGPSADRRGLITMGGRGASALVELL